MSKTALIRGSLILVIAAFVLVCLLVGAWWLDVQNNRHEYPSYHHRWAYSVQPTTVEDWMTFNYLNTILGLPPTYLQSALHITDSRYPDISIRQYAQSHALDVDTVLTQLQNAVAAYSATSTP